MTKIKDKEYILNGIKAYKPIQEKIIKFIKEKGGKITDDEFDEEFSPIKRKLIGEKDGLSLYQPVLSNSDDFLGYDENSFILGSLQDSFGLSRYIDLIQCMVCVGLIRRRIYKNKKVIYYLSS